MKGSKSRSKRARRRTNESALELKKSSFQAIYHSYTHIHSSDTGVVVFIATATMSQLYRGRHLTAVRCPVFSKVQRLTGQDTCTLYRPMGKARSMEKGMGRMAGITRHNSVVYILWKPLNYKCISPTDTLIFLFLLLYHSRYIECSILSSRQEPCSATFGQDSALLL